MAAAQSAEERGALLTPLQALQYLEENIIPATDAFDVKSEADVSKRLRVRLPGTRPPLRPPHSRPRAPFLASSTAARTW